MATIFARALIRYKSEPVVLKQYLRFPEKPLPNPFSTILSRIGEKELKYDDR